MKECILCKPRTNIKEYKYWNLGVCPTQHTLGSLVIVLKQHKELFAELTEEEVLELRKIIIYSQKLLDKRFKPDWYNVQQNGNWEQHLHVHVLPRYKEKREFNKRIFIDKTFGQPVIYTSELESEKFIKDLTNFLLK